MVVTVYVYIFIHVGKEMKIIEFAKGLDLDEVVYLELHCLPSILWILILIHPG